MFKKVSENNSLTNCEARLVSAYDFMGHFLNEYEKEIKNVIRIMIT